MLLPPELLLHILDALDTCSRSTLYSLSVVSQSWRAIAETQIFALVVVDPSSPTQDLPCFLTFLRRRPHIQTYVRRLRIRASSPIPLHVMYNGTGTSDALPPGEVPLSVLYDILRRLQGLQSLIIHSVHMISKDLREHVRMRNRMWRYSIIVPNPRESTSTPDSGSKISIGRLELHQLHVDTAYPKEDVSGTLTSLLSMFSAIDTLCISNGASQRSNISDSPLNTPPRSPHTSILQRPRIDVLELSKNISTEILDLLDQSVGIQRITSLRFSSASKSIDAGLGGY